MHRVVQPKKQLSYIIRTLFEKNFFKNCQIRPALMLSCTCRKERVQRCGSPTRVNRRYCIAVLLILIVSHLKVRVMSK